MKMQFFLSIYFYVIQESPLNGFRCLYLFELLLLVIFLRNGSKGNNKPLTKTIVSINKYNENSKVRLKKNLTRMLCSVRRI